MLLSNGLCTKNSSKDVLISRYGCTLKDIKYFQNSQRIFLPTSDGSLETDSADLLINSVSALQAHSPTENKTHIYTVEL